MDHSPTYEVQNGTPAIKKETDESMIHEKYNSDLREECICVM